jgi:hypothetical protein
VSAARREFGSRARHRSFVEEVFLWRLSATLMMLLVVWLVNGLVSPWMARPRVPITMMTDTRYLIDPINVGPATAFLEQHPQLDTPRMQVIGHRARGRGLTLCP